MAHLGTAFPRPRWLASSSSSTRIQPHRTFVFLFLFKHQSTRPQTHVDLLLLSLTHCLLSIFFHTSKLCSHSRSALIFNLFYFLFISFLSIWIWVSSIPAVFSLLAYYPLIFWLNASKFGFCESGSLFCFVFLECQCAILDLPFWILLRHIWGHCCFVQNPNYRYLCLVGGKVMVGKENKERKNNIYLWWCSSKWP